ADRLRPRGELRPRTGRNGEAMSVRGGYFGAANRQEPDFCSVHVSACPPPSAPVARSRREAASGGAAKSAPETVAVTTCRTRSTTTVTVGVAPRVLFHVARTGVPFFDFTFHV